MAIGNDVLSETILAIHPEVSMALTRTTPFLQAAKELGKIHYFGGNNSASSGSYKLRIPIEVAESTQTTDVSTTGYEALNLSVQDATRYAEFTWGRWVRPVIISRKERAENSGDAAIISLAETRYRNGLGGLKRDLNRQIISNSSVTGVEAAFTSAYTPLGTLWGAAGSSGGSSTGFFEPLDPASQVNSVGGLSKSTFNIPGWTNQYKDVGNAFSNNGLPAFRHIRTRAALNREMARDDRTFHAVLLHPTTKDLYEGAMYTNARYANTKDLDAGKFVLMFEDAPVYADPAFISTTGNDIGVADFKLSGYFLNLDGVTLAIHEDADFTFGEFERISTQDVDMALITFMGGLIAKNLGSSGLVVDALA